jgi:hypothetical protein
LPAGGVGRDIDRKNRGKRSWVVRHRDLLAKRLEMKKQAGDRPKAR